MKVKKIVLLVLLSLAVPYISSQANVTGKDRRAKNVLKFERKLRVDDRMEWEYVVEPPFSGPYSVGCINKKGPKAHSNHNCQAISTVKIV